jgi:hypothetical protein
MRAARKGHPCLLQSQHEACSLFGQYSSSREEKITKLAPTTLWARMRADNMTRPEPAAQSSNKVTGSGVRVVIASRISVARSNPVQTMSSLYSFRRQIHNLPSISEAERKLSNWTRDSVTLSMPL